MPDQIDDLWQHGGNVIGAHELTDRGEGSANLQRVIALKIFLDGLNHEQEELVLLVKEQRGGKVTWQVSDR